MRLAVNLGGKLDNNQNLDKNLQQISKYNPDLKYKLLRSKFTDSKISFVKTVLQEDNLIYDNTYVHNNYGAEAEAREIVEKIQNEYTSIIVLYGIGLGYLFQETVKQAKGIVLLYEPNFDILYTTLANKDLSKELAKTNVFVYSDFDLLKKAYIQNFKYKSDTHIAFLPSYNTLFKDDIVNFAKDLNVIMSMCVASNNFIKNDMFLSIVSVCNNIDLLINEPVPEQYKGIYDGKNAIIISSDKNINGNIETIKKYRQNTIIFAVDKVLSILITNGITPNFVGFSAINNHDLKLEGLNLSEINAIVEPLTIREIHELKFKNIISYPSRNSLPNLIWTSLSNINALPYYSCETPSYTLLKTAQIFGFSDIILVGQNYTSEKSYFEDFAKKHDDLKLYNVSTDEIEGFMYASLEELIKSKPNMQKIDLNNKNNIDIINLVKNINQEILGTEEIIKLLKSASALILNADKELQDKNNLTEIFLNYFKQILTIYADLKEIYAAKNRLFLYLQQSYSLDLEYELGKNNEKNSIPKVYELLKVYVSSLTSNLTEIKEILKLKAVKLNEMLNTES